MVVGIIYILWYAGKWKWTCKVQPASVTLSAYGFHSTFFYKVSFISYVVPCKRRKETMSTGEYLQYVCCFSSVLLCRGLFLFTICSGWAMVLATSATLSLSLSGSLHFCAISEFGFYQRPRECWRAALMERQDWLCYSRVSPGEALAGGLACTSGLTPVWKGVKNSPTQLLYTAPWGVWQSQLFPPTDACSPQTNGIGNKTSSPTLAAKVGSKILCLGGFKLYFVLLVGLQASLSLFMEFQ